MRTLDYGYCIGRNRYERMRISDFLVGHYSLADSVFIYFNGLPLMQVTKSGMILVRGSSTDIGSVIRCSDSDGKFNEFNWVANKLKDFADTEALVIDSRVGVTKATSKKFLHLKVYLERLFSCI